MIGIRLSLSHSPAAIALFLQSSRAFDLPVDIMTVVICNRINPLRRAAVVYCVFIAAI